MRRFWRFGQRLISDIRHVLVRRFRRGLRASPRAAIELDCLLDIAVLDIAMALRWPRRGLTDIPAIKVCELGCRLAVAVICMAIALGWPLNRLFLCPQLRPQVICAAPWFVGLLLALLFGLGRVQVARQVD